MLLGCKRTHKPGRAFSGFSRTFMELYGSKVQPATPQGNFINGVANPEIVYYCQICMEIIVMLHSKNLALSFFFTHTNVETFSKCKHCSYQNISPGGLLTLRFVFPFFTYLRFNLLWHIHEALNKGINILTVLSAFEIAALDSV